MSTVWADWGLNYTDEMGKNDSRTYSNFCGTDEKKKTGFSPYFELVLIRTRKGKIDSRPYSELLWYGQKDKKLDLVRILSCFRYGREGKKWI